MVCGRFKDAPFHGGNTGSIPVGRARQINDLAKRMIADIRELVDRHLPAECRERDTWQHVAAQMNAAARGGGITPELRASSSRSLHRG